MTGNCKTCGAPLKRHKGESDWNWDKREHCDRACYLIRAKQIRYTGPRRGRRV